MIDVGDEKQVAAQELQAERIKHRDANLWTQVLSSYEGRYVINCILENMARPFAISFNPDNSRLTDFREGGRNVGNMLIAHAFGDRPKLMDKMRDEHAEREKELNNV